MNAPAEQKTAPTEQVKRALYLSHFTPSMMPPETLEAMLVQREPLLTRVLGHVSESLRTSSRHHTLLVGPRGIGKTHLISLLHHRLSQSQEAKDKALIAWMREEEWGVTSFFELVMRILRTLDATYPQFDIAKRTEPLYELKVDDAAKQAEALLLDVLADKCLVIFLENLDDLFDQIGDQGQKAWRAFIQNHGNMVLVCTTPSLFAGVSIHRSPFYGFFDIEPLVELEFEDVVSLLRKTAAERGDADLVAFIDTPEGRARIRAVHHLAEGNPRIYIIFAQFLSHEALDELVQAFMHTLDELTPYYQARMKELPGQQRKILEYLVNYRGAAQVKTIAKACFISQQVCSSQLKQLKVKRYVRSTDHGRESFYELSEPMMRLCMEVKKQRGEPISLFVDMLRIWYRIEDLEEWLSKSAVYQHIDKKYLKQAIRASKENGDPKVSAWFKEFHHAVLSKNYDEQDALLMEFGGLDIANSNIWEIYAFVLGANAYRDKKIVANQSVIRDLERLNNGLSQVIHRLLKVNMMEVPAITSILSTSLVLHSLDQNKADKSLFDASNLFKMQPAKSTVALAHVVFRLADVVGFQDWMRALKSHINSAPIIADISFAFTAMRDALSSRKRSDLLKLPLEQRKLVSRFFMEDFAQTKTSPQSLIK